MPSDNVVPPVFRFGGEPMDTAPSPAHKKRDRLKAYKEWTTPEALASYRAEYESQTDTLQHISFTEYATFKAENRIDVMNIGLGSIRSKYFGFPVIQHSDQLVEFYTGLPNASQFYYISSMLQRWIFRSYIKWEADEKHGFLNHTMIALMKLRLNMPDEELATRFGIQPYMVNMTMRTWLPGLYICVYKTCEDMYRVPANNDVYLYSKVADIVEVCFETPEYTRRFRGDKHEARKALVSVRNDGFINYASSVVSIHRPDDATFKRSRFADTCYNMDRVAVPQEFYNTVCDMGIVARTMSHHATYNFKETMERLSEFRILMAIPGEYRTFHEYIFPVCAALCNFSLVVDDDHVPNDELPDPEEYE